MSNLSNRASFVLPIDVVQDALIAQDFLHLSDKEPYINTSPHSSYIRVSASILESNESLSSLVDSLPYPYYGSVANSSKSSSPQSTLDVIEEITSSEAIPRLQAMQKPSCERPELGLILPEDIMSYEARLKQQNSWKSGQKRLWRNIWWKFSSTIERYFVC